MDKGQVQFRREGSVAHIVFDRPQARNAMTWEMYQRLGEICDELIADDSVRAAVFRGAGGEAFVAGTDIEQFLAFKDGEDGIRYEVIIDGMIAKIESLPFPTIAVVEGWAIGGGMAIASACDFRIATPSAQFGIPIARTLGNTLSMANHARVVAAVGVARAKRMLLMAETISAAEAKAAGFVYDVVEPEAIAERANEAAAKLAKLAPVTVRASKEAIRRIVNAGLPDGDDLVRACYGSDDFREGVRAFTEKRKPVWRGR
ncbi:Enoyl-CoA hydratase/carnithine racemase [Noviherbaspirillum humi]|uniref:Enoyl-CoA hydratase/carnithine racemase n=1 Tax=Noviherbaspirillum humi TaxID=1688639 RepID=A0A239M1M8_9BURK|nr:enoyl-CoA hydratase/isomerase family protein [Noviherbaspirillum humi]SNT36202.1 Enoyl-CoA hydratase/carnithine racemase [Noviherbaspirillum humi]